MQGLTALTFLSADRNRIAQLKFLDRLTNLRGSSALPSFCAWCSWSLLPYHCMHVLTPALRWARVVLIASHNSITKMGKLAPLVNLRTLVLNDNQITKIEGLETLSELETLGASRPCVGLQAVLFHRC